MILSFHRLTDKIFHNSDILLLSSLGAYSVSYSAAYYIQFIKSNFYLQDTYKIQEPILNLRRTILSLAQQAQISQPDDADLKAEIGNCWLRTAKIARE